MLKTILIISIILNMFLFGLYIVNVNTINDYKTVIEEVGVIIPFAIDIFTEIRETGIYMTDCYKLNQTYNGTLLFCDDFGYFDNIDWWPHYPLE